jgi:hypothetical protein
LILLVRLLNVLLRVEDDSGRATLQRRKAIDWSGDTPFVGEGRGEAVEMVDVGDIGAVMDVFVDDVEGYRE